MPRLLIVVVALAACAIGAGSGAPRHDAVSVSRIIDGDSLLVDTARGEMEVRLSGVNTPERGECHYAEAAKALAVLVDEARLSLTVEGTDQYGRALARLDADGIDIALEMVRGGHGVAAAAASNPANLVTAEDAAHAASLGMWAPEACGGGPLPLLRFLPGSSTPDPPGPDDDVLGGEVVVLINGDLHVVDLAGWVLRDGSSLHRYVFPSGTRLEPGATIGVASADPAWTPGASPVWSNQGDIALLLDPSGRVVARWRY